MMIETSSCNNNTADQDALMGAETTQSETEETSKTVTTPAVVAPRKTWGLPKAEGESTTDPTSQNSQQKKKKKTLLEIMEEEKKREQEDKGAKQRQLEEKLLQEEEAALIKAMEASMATSSDPVSGDDLKNTTMDEDLQLALKLSM